MNPLFRMTATLMFASLSMGVFAQVKNFEGLNASGFIGYQSATAKVTDLLPGGRTISGIAVSDATISGATLNIGLEYIVPIDDKYTIGVGINANALPTTSGRHVITLNGTNIGDFDNKNTSQYSIFISPGMVLSSETLLYTKLGYVQLANELLEVGASDTSKILNTAYSFGLGMKQLFNKNTFFFAEINYIALIAKDQIETDGSKYKTSGSSINGGVGIGYKF